MVNGILAFGKGACGRAVILLFSLFAAPVAADVDQKILRCSAIADPQQRLGCYDRAIQQTRAASPPAQKPVDINSKRASPTGRRLPLRVELGGGFQIASVDSPFSARLVGDPVDLAFQSFLGGRGALGQLEIWYDGVFHDAISLGLTYGHSRMSGDARADFPDGVQVIADPVFNDISYNARVDSLMLGLSATLFSSRAGSSFLSLQAGLSRLDLETVVRTNSPLLAAPEISVNRDTVIAPVWAVTTGYRFHLTDHWYAGAKFGLNGINGSLFGQDGRAVWAMNSQLFAGYRF
ncbi:hypothetical protein [Minwuia sp.]|uniref:hypothetical protein n=1 Tax=Minwuia sp. TaxID=2493630 RepID=UPI003A94FA6A